MAVRPDIDAIIVHYHAAKLLAEAVDALQRDARDSGLTLNVVVADNGSTAEERELLRSLDITYVPSGRDAGYAGGANIGFEHTTADTILLMNEDVMVQRGCLTLLRDALRNGAAVAGPEFAWDREQVLVLPCTEERTRANELLKVSARRSAERLALARQRWRAHARRHWRATSPIESTAISGALVAFRRDTWAIVGPWDDGYQMYFDENDWLFRVERAGLKSMYVPRAKAIHLHNPKLMGDPDRAQWASESFARFGNRYYGERFMRRLFALGSRPQSVILTVSAANRKDLPASHGEGPSSSSRLRMTPIAISRDAHWPVWVEVTPTPLGFPAAAARIHDVRTTEWSPPPLGGLDFLTMPLYVTLVDDGGRELRRAVLQRTPELALA